MYFPTFYKNLHFCSVATDMMMSLLRSLWLFDRHWW